MQTARERWLVGGFLLVGTALRAWQYGGGAALWINEIAVMRNVIDRSALDLVSRPLDYDQSAPAGYLLLSKAAVVVFGAGEAALRLPPFLAALAALALFPSVAYRLLDRRAAVLASFLFAVAVPLIQYGAEAKQYSFDVLATVAIMLVAVRWWERSTPARAATASATGVVAVWFSNAAVLVIAGVGVALAAGTAIRQQRGLWPQLLGIGVGWVAAAGAATAVARRMMDDGTHAFFVRFWRSGFPPDALLDWPGWLGRHLVRILGSDLGYPVPWVALALIVAGLAAMVRRPLAGAILVAPVLVTLAAAGLHMYPFGERLTLFLLPLFLMLLAAGADALLRPLPRRPAIAVVALIVAAALWATWRQRPVLHQQDVRPALTTLRDEWQPGDRLYVYSGAWQAARFYGPRLGITDDDVVYGDCHRRQPRRLLAELDQFRGRRRLWVLITHALPGFAERRIITSYLDTIGVRRGSLEIMPEPIPPAAPPAWVETRLVGLYLYDLSDPARSAGAEAATFTLPPIPGDERVDCHYGASIPRVGL